MSLRRIPALVAALVAAALGLALTGCGGGAPQAGGDRAQAAPLQAAPASRPRPCDDGGSGGVMIDGVCL